MTYWLSLITEAGKYYNVLHFLYHNSSDIIIDLITSDFQIDNKPATV